MYNYLSLAILVPALCWVVCSDLLYRCIHNRLIVLLLVLWLILPVLNFFGLDVMFAGEGTDFWLLFSQTLFGALVVLLIGFALFHFEIVGAGDVKLIAVLCLWIGGEKQLEFILITSLIGGVVVLLLPVLSMIEILLARMFFAFTTRYIGLEIVIPIVLTEQRPSGIPYGLAISGAMFYMLFFSAYF